MKTCLTQLRVGVNRLTLSVFTFAFVPSVGFQSRCAAGDAAPPSSAERKPAPLNPFEQAAAAPAAVKPATTLNPFELAVKGADLNPFEQAARGARTAAGENPFQREACLVREELARQEAARQEKERLELARREQEQRRAAEQAAQLAKQRQDSELGNSGDDDASGFAYRQYQLRQNQEWQQQQNRKNAQYNWDVLQYNSGASRVRPLPPTPSTKPFPGR